MSHVRRRYSDFRCLREAVIDRFPQYASLPGIASFPPKHSLLTALSPLSPRQLQDRVYGLAEFLFFCQRHHDVMTCPLFTMFLEVVVARTSLTRSTNSQW